MKCRKCCELDWNAIRVRQECIKDTIIMIPLLIYLAHSDVQCVAAATDRYALISTSLIHDDDLCV